MGIDLRWKDEKGLDLAAVEDSQNLLARHVRGSDGRGTICLRFVDSYGDAMFNQGQIPILVQELEASIEREKDSAVLEHVRKVLLVLGRATAQVHTYVWFIGD